MFAVTGSLRICQQRNHCEFQDVNFFSSTCGKVGSKLKFLFTIHTQFEQYTYLGYVLLEAPHEYVLHGPLLSIYWLRLCPHLGGPASEAMPSRGGCL
jgi:hypothetical protein